MPYYRKQRTVIKVLSKYHLAYSRNATQTFFPLLTHRCQKHRGTGKHSWSINNVAFKDLFLAQLSELAVWTVFYSELVLNCLRNLVKSVNPWSSQLGFTVAWKQCSLAPFLRRTCGVLTEWHLPSTLSWKSRNFHGAEAWGDRKSLTCGRCRGRGLGRPFRKSSTGLEPPQGAAQCGWCSLLCGLQPLPRDGCPPWQEPAPHSALLCVAFPVLASCQGSRPCSTVTLTVQDKAAIHSRFPESSEDTVFRIEICLLNWKKILPHLFALFSFWPFCYSPALWAPLWWRSQKPSVLSPNESTLSVQFLWEFFGLYPLIVEINIVSNICKSIFLFHGIKIILSRFKPDLYS